MANKIDDSKRLIKPGRALLAAVGLRRALEPGGLKITKDDFEKSTKIEPKIVEIVNDFLDGKREPSPLPPYKHDEIEDLLFQTMSPETATEKLSRFNGHPAGDDFFAAVKNAVNFLQSKIPRRFRNTFTGPRPVEPSRAELMTWRWYLETVTNPLWAIGQLKSATFSGKTIEALSSEWPDVLQAATRAATQGIADRLEKDKNLSFSRWQIRQLAVLTKNDPTALPHTVQMWQNAYAQTEQPPAKSEPGSEDSDYDVVNMQTSLQKTANR